jgi:predicted dehydrogenase
MPNRRSFLKSLTLPAAAVGFPAIVPGSALGLDGAVPASDRVTLASIGVGWQGGSHVDAFLKLDGAQYVALADLDDEHAAENKAKVDRKYGNTDCKTYRAFEEVLSRKDIDAVSIAVPDHWHGVVAFSAARAGKDIYCEKPLAHNFVEGRAISDAVTKYTRIFQTGSWQRSTANFRQACELVRNGRIGKVTRIEVGLPGGWTDFAKTKDQDQITAPPAHIDYDRWMGPSQEMPFIMARFHKNWRWNLNTGGGQLMDWVGHHVDIAHWGMGWDATGPVEIEGKGEYPPRDAMWNTAGKYWIDYKYPDGTPMVIAGGFKEIAGGTKWIGSEGWVYVDRGKLQASNTEWIKPGADTGPIKLTVSNNHYQQFLDCVKSRQETLTPAHVALRSATPGWLGQISMLTGRKLTWDPVRMELAGDAAAGKLLSREQRMPWHLS